jgi:hypothetical protein
VGDKVEVDFSADAPAGGVSTYDFTVTTDKNATSGTSNSITNTSVPPTVSSTSTTIGGNAQYTISGVPVITPSTTGVTITAAPGVVLWYNGAGGYTATYTANGGTATADTVESAVPGAGDTVLLTLNNAIVGTALAPGTLTLTADATNPSVASTDGFTVTPTGGTGEATTNTLTFGTSVSVVVVAPSPAVTGATATYTVSFKATDGIAALGTITATETNSGGSTNFSGVTDVLISDPTASWGHVVVAATTATAGGTLVVTLPAGDAVAAGDTVTLTVPGVVNPSAGTISDFTVADSTDTVATTAAAYSIGASGAAGIMVSANPNTPSTTATYTISNLYASGTIAATTAGDDIALTAPAGTLLPDASTYYVVTDTTTPSGSGTASSTGFTYATGQPCGVATGASCTVVSFEVPNAINSGDLLTITVSDVVNPSSGAYTMGVGGLISGPSAVAPFPGANVAYPNGAIVNFSGTFYLFAGGHAFGIPTQTVLAKLQSVDHATVLKAAAGAILPTTVPRPGTLITTNAVNANATIYVVGTDGELHGFATGAQYLGDGYDPALNVTVPSLGGLTVGGTAGAEGTAVTAFATLASGAIIDSSGTYYVLDGGKAFGIPTPAALTIVRKPDSATPLTGTITSTQTAATIASGTLLTVNGIVYVAYVGNLIPFKTPAQLLADGFGGTASVTATNLGGLSVVSVYSGS